MNILKTIVPVVLLCCAVSLIGNIPKRITDNLEIEKEVGFAIYNPEKLLLTYQVLENEEIKKANSINNEEYFFVQVGGGRKTEKELNQILSSLKLTLKVNEETICGNLEINFGQGNNFTPIVTVEKQIQKSMFSKIYSFLWREVGEYTADYKVSQARIIRTALNKNKN